MTDLGLAFDDDDLLTHKQKHSYDKDLPYHVKVHEPMWFDEPTQSSVSSDQQPFVHKFSGDNHYRLKDFVAAAQQYKAALDILPSNNVAVNQDLRESLIRCYAYMGECDEALLLARKMVQEMSTEDEAHQRQSLILLCFVCEKAGFMREYLATLEILCVLQPNLPQVWITLGDALTKMVAQRHHVPNQCGDGSDVPSCVHVDNDRETECSRLRSVCSCEDGSTLNCEPHPNSGNVMEDVNESTSLSIEHYRVLALTCYVRAKLLLDSVMANASNLIRARNKTLTEEVTDKINSQPFEEDTIQQAFHSSRRYLDVSQDEGKLSSEEKSAHQNGISLSFYQKFCSWHTEMLNK